MTLCDKHHAQVCFEGHDCPVCDIAYQRDKFEARVKELETELEEVRSQVSDLESKIP